MSIPYGRGGGRRGSRWWVWVVVFLVGIGVGILAVGMLSVGVPTFRRPAAAATTASVTQPGPAPSGSPTVGPGAQVRANAACLQAIRDAQDVYGVINGLGQALTAVDLARLDTIVRQLQPLQPRLQGHLRDCNVDTQVEPGNLSPSPSPTG